MSRKGESVTLSLSEADKEKLEAIASESGCTWGDRANISKLMSEIANRRLLVHRIDEPINSKTNERGRKAIALIIKGLTELSLIWFG